MAKSEPDALRELIGKQDYVVSRAQARAAGLTEEALRHLLDKLQAAEFIYTTQLFPDLQYTFKHSLICDVAYSGVLRDTRRKIHAGVVGAIERLYADRLAEQVERLAYHSVRGELREKAVHYSWQAGAKAAARGALQEARTSFEQALDILKYSAQAAAATAFVPAIVVQSLSEHSKPWPQPSPTR